MSDAPGPTQLTARNKIVNAVIVSGWIVLVLLLLVIVGSVIWLMATGQPVTDQHLQMATLALGYLFGKFDSLIQRYMGETK